MFQNLFVKPRDNIKISIVPPVPKKIEARRTLQVIVVVQVR